MGNKHVHHHHPPPPSLEERRKNTKAKLEDIKRHHEAALAEIRREQQLLNERLKEEAEINQENQRRALEISQAAASEREARRQEHLRALKAERQTILQEIKDVDAQLKACRDQLTNANKDVSQLTKKVKLEEQNVREQDRGRVRVWVGLRGFCDGVYIVWVMPNSWRPSSGGQAVEENEEDQWSKQQAVNSSCSNQSPWTITKGSF